MPWPTWSSRSPAPSMRMCSASPMRRRKTSPTSTRMRVVCSSIALDLRRRLAGEAMRRPAATSRAAARALAQRERRAASRQQIPQVVMVRSKLAAVIAGADPRGAALRAELRRSPRCRRASRPRPLRDVSPSITISSTRADIRVERGLHRAAQRRAKGVVGRGAHALVFRADLRAGAHDAAGKRHDHVGHSAIAADGGFGRGAASLRAVRPRISRLPPPTACLVRPVVASQTNSPSITGMRQ